MSVLDLSPSEFNSVIAELETQGVDVSDLRRQYREKSSTFAGLFDYAGRQQDRIADAGRRSIGFGLLSKPEGSVGMDAVRGVQFEPTAFLSGLLETVARGVDAPRAAAQGLIPAEDMAGEAFGTAGSAMLGGGAVVRPAGSVGMGGRVAELRRQANIERFGRDPNEVQAGSDVLSEYVGQHRAPMRDEGAPAFDLAGDIYPDDIYSPKAVQYYGTGSQSMDEDTMGLLQSLRGEPDADVTIYRAVPKGVDRLNTGDWVTVNRQYALDHGESSLGGDFDIVERTVKAKDIFTNGDSIHEFGYDPSTTAANASKSAGLLGVASDVADRGDAVLNMLKSGRGSDVTDEMLDMGDSVKNTQLNQYLFENYDLPMDEASRMARGAAAGFDVSKDLYHGTSSVFDAFDGNQRQHYATTSPYVAASYAPRTGNIIPLLAKAENGSPLVEAGGASWGDMSAQMIPEELPQLRNAYLQLDPNKKHKTYELADEARASGYSGISFKDIIDRGGYGNNKLNADETMDELRERQASMSAPSNVEVRFAPNQYRSRFARFDPRLSHLSSLNAANASPTAGLLSQAGMSERQAERTEGILQTMGLLD